MLKHQKTTEHKLHKIWRTAVLQKFRKTRTRLEDYSLLNSPQVVFFILLSSVRISVQSMTEK